MARSISGDLAHIIEAFEDSLDHNPDTDWVAFLPSAEHPSFDHVFVELVRIDVERNWTAGTPKPLDSYLDRHVRIRKDSKLLAAAAFEDFRQRRKHGASRSAESYRDQYGIDVSEWSDAANQSDDPAAAESVSAAQAGGFATEVAGVVPLPLPESMDGGSYLSDTGMLDKWRAAIEAVPDAGSDFLGFRLIRELGRGAFARVFLARQGSLGSRYVVLKIATDIVAESVTLAQLQHTNIVPIYSFHRSGSYQAVCMPYFGRTTLAQVLKSLDNGRSIPQSGRQLRSTITVMAHSRRSVSASKPGSDPSSVPAEPEVVDVTTANEGEVEPFLGLSPEGWMRLEGLSYVEAILTLGVQLADGLAHAHARGILHRDIKPANILFTDEGRPMLLDFNLAEDVKTRGSAERAAIGGTLQYMAPEHMEAFRASRGRLDARCDLFSIGCIFYELLTGRHAYPVRTGGVRDKLTQMLEDRRQRPESPRRFNPAVSPATSAIILKCLAPQPADRYQSADDLREDLQRQLRHQSLKHAGNPSWGELGSKWVRRHPRLASSASVAVFALAVLLSVAVSYWYMHDRERNLAARATYADHVAAFSDAQLFLDDRHQGVADLDAATGKLLEVLNRYGVSRGEDANPQWQLEPDYKRLNREDQSRVVADVGEAFYLLAHVGLLKAAAEPDPAKRSLLLEQSSNEHELARRYASSRLRRALIAQQNALAMVLGRKVEPEPEIAAGSESPRDLFLVGMLHHQNGRHRDALTSLVKATLLEPRNFSAWFVRGTAHLALDEADKAAECFSACLAIRSDFAPAWFNRGFAQERAYRFDDALDDFDKAQQLDPGQPGPFIRRGRIRIDLDDLAAAEAEYTRGLATGRNRVRLHFLRASVRDRLKNVTGAADDRREGFAIEPDDALGWLARAENRTDTDPAAALKDVDAALRLNPRSIDALQLKAHLLGEKRDQPAAALAALSLGIELHPQHASLLAGRGVLHARAGRDAEALRDADAAWRAFQSPPNAFQVGSIHALLAPRRAASREEAMRLIWFAMKDGYGIDLARTDPDLKAIRDDPKFQKDIADAETIQNARRVR